MEKNRSRRYDINRPRPRHGHEYRKYKTCFSKHLKLNEKGKQH